MDCKDNVMSHVVTITPTESFAPSPSLSLCSSINTEFSMDIPISEHSEQEFSIPQKEEPTHDEPVPPLQKQRGFFQTCSSGSLHHLLNEVVVAPQLTDHLKILPPPSFIYLKTVNGQYTYKHVLMTEKGDRYIMDDENSKVYLQDIKGLYRYNTM
jgi:hypothetical protein